MVRRAVRSGTVQNENQVVQGDSPAPSGPEASGQQSAAPAAGSAEAPAPGASDASPQEQAARPQQPRQRIPFGTQEMKMVLPHREGYRPYWFTDKPGRIERAQAAGYDFIRDADGQPKKIVTGVREGGGPQYSYAMEIPIAWFNEDFLKEQAHLDEIDATIRGGGKANVDSDKRYVPAHSPIRIEPGR